MELKDHLGIWLLAVVFFIFLITPGTSPTSPLKNKGEDYVEAIRLGSDWFLKQENERFIHYAYNLRLNTHAETSHPLRELASLWAIAESAQFFQNDHYVVLAKKGLSYFKQFIRHDSARSSYYLEITPDIKLGYSAFMILSLLSIDDLEKEIYLEGFAKGILDAQQSDGSLKPILYSNQLDGVDYYPGEALFALMRLYEHTRKREYLDVVGNAFSYYEHYWESKPNTAFTPWQSRAYRRYYDVTGDPHVASFVYSMSDYILAFYEPRKKCSNFILSNPALAAHAEGVVEAYLVAHKEGDTSRMRCYSNFIRETADYLLSTQLKDTDTYSPEAIGGFKTNSESASLRVDRNQHIVIFLMDAYRAGLLST